MYRFVALQILLAFNRIRTVSAAATSPASTSTSTAPITLITSNGVVTSFILNSQPIESTLELLFANPPRTNTCPTGLSKRDAVNCNVLALTEYGLSSLSNNAALKDTLIMFPTNFPSLLGPLTVTLNQIASFVTTNNLFKGYAGPVVHAILVVTLLAANQFHTYHSGLSTITIPQVAATSTARPSSSSSCPFVTLTITTPTSTLSTIPIPCAITNCLGEAPKCAAKAKYANCPCLGMGRMEAAPIMNPDTWNANKLFFEQQFDSPLCWPNSTSVKGGYATWCVCGQTAAASGTSGTMQTESVTATVFPTKSGPTQAACAYSSFGQLPTGKYTPPTVTPTPTSCVTTTQTVSSSLTSTFCTCDDNYEKIPLTSWILSNQPTTQCSTGQTPPAGAITANPGAVTTSADWSIGFYAGTTCGQTPWPTFGATMSGTGVMACQNLPQTTYGGEVSISIGNPNLGIWLYADHGCPNSPWKYYGPISGCENGFGVNVNGPGPPFSPYSIAAWQVPSGVVAGGA